MAKIRRDKLAFVLSQRLKLKPTKPIRTALPQKYGTKILSTSCVVFILYVTELDVVTDNHRRISCFFYADRVPYAIVFIPLGSIRRRMVFTWVFGVTLPIVVAESRCSFFFGIILFFFRDIFRYFVY